MSWFTSPDSHPFAFERGSDTAVLMLHGFMGSPAELRPLGRALAAAGIDAHGIVLPGFGPDIARLGRVGKREWIEAGLAAWGELAGRYRRLALLGFSMGGALALHVAAAARPRPERLILLAPLTRLRDPRAILLPVAKYFVDALHPFATSDFDDPETRAYFSENMPGVDLDNPAARQELRSQAVMPLSTLDALRSVAGDTTRLALKLGQPVTIVQGFEDEVVDHMDTRRLAHEFAGPLTLREVHARHQLVREDGPGWREVREAILGAVCGDERG